MRRAGQPPRAILSAPGNGRVSFECDLIDKTTRQNQHSTADNYGRFAPPSVARKEPLSSSAPSTLFLYQPFSSDKGPPSPLVKDVDRQQSHKKRAFGGFDRFDSTTNAAPVGGGNEERARLVPLILTTEGHADDNGNNHDSDHDNDDVTKTKDREQVVPQEPTPVQQRSLRASTKTMTTADTAPAPLPLMAPSSSRASLLFSSSTTIAPSSSSETVVATASTTGPLSAPIVSCLSTSSARVDSKPKTSSHLQQNTKVQRRQSSEDGLTTSTTHDLAIPTKCRMVFHMRDEVSKVKGLCANDGGLANFRPLPQPRQWQAAPQYPLRATTSLKTTKTVSFQEPEPWKKRSSEEITSPRVVLISKDEVSSRKPTALVTRSTLQADDERGQLSDEAEDATTATATAATNVVARPASASVPAIRPSAVMEDRGHAGNFSAPSPSADSSMAQRMEAKPLPMARTSTNNSYNSSSNTGKGSPPTSNGGNRFSRLWKSVAQKVGTGHSHSHRHIEDDNNGYPTNKHHHVYHSQSAQGSDLEPLVVNAK
ncbi:hypothetical protein EMPS_07088 [Entomortierella parvispora]|uniref:Uncharacterized protein n=1 Tax=Entomortierella parvispora TaxID=205924 RepID=A0A9P3HDH5_9FUNG|nr:hypothetical protein EMPS_07088 [Entomortierella parvispora]